MNRTRIGPRTGTRQKATVQHQPHSCCPFTSDRWLTPPHSPLSIFFFYLGQASSRVHQTGPEGTGISGFQSTVNENHS